MAPAAETAHHQQAQACSESWWSCALCNADGWRAGGAAVRNLGEEGRTWDVDWIPVIGRVVPCRAVPCRAVPNGVMHWVRATGAETGFAADVGWREVLDQLLTHDAGKEKKSGIKGASM